MMYMYMKLLSAVAKPTRAATVDRPIVGDSIEIILNDANKLTFEGTDPKVALINANLIPYIPGGGTFVVNASNNLFLYATSPIANKQECQIQNGTYTRADFIQAIADAINLQGSSLNADDEWPMGMDVQATTVENILNINTYFLDNTDPYFNMPEYWVHIDPFPEFSQVTTNSIDNLFSDAPITLLQNLNGSTIPRCRFNFEGVVTGVPDAPNPQELFVISIAKDDIPDYIQFGFQGAQWFTNIAGVRTNNVLNYIEGSNFRISVDSDRVTIYINNGVADVELIYNIDGKGWVNRDSEISLSVTVFHAYKLGNVKCTLNPTLGTPQYNDMMLRANSYIDWNTEILEVMTGSGSRTLNGTIGTPSVITGSTPLLANNSIGKVLVCLDMECGGHLSGPVTKAVRKFIYTIPDGASNFYPCTTIATELYPISLDLRGYTSISRISVQFVQQVTDQLVGFTAPASITLAFLE